MTCGGLAFGATLRFGNIKLALELIFEFLSERVRTVGLPWYFETVRFALSLFVTKKKTLSWRSVYTF